MRKTTTIAALSAVAATLAMGQGDIHIITEPDLLAYGYATTNEVAAGVSALKEDVDSRGYAPTNAVRTIVEGYGYATESVTNGLASTGALAAHAEATNNPHAVTKAQVGLGNVDNTSDADKPVSTAQQDALDGKVSKSGDQIEGNLMVRGMLEVENGNLIVPNGRLVVSDDHGAFGTELYKEGIRPPMYSAPLLFPDYVPGDYFASRGWTTNSIASAITDLITTGGGAVSSGSDPHGEYIHIPAGGDYYLSDFATVQDLAGLTDYNIGIYGESGGIFKTMDNVTAWVKGLSGWSLSDTAPIPSASDMRSYILGAHVTLENILDGDVPVPQAGHASSANHATYLWSDSKEDGYTYSSLTTALDGKADVDQIPPAVHDLSWSIPVNSVSSSTTTNFALGLVYGGILASDDGVHIGTMGRVRDNTLLYRTVDSKVYSVHDGAWWLVGQYPGFVHTTENGFSSTPPNCAIAIGNDAGAVACAVSIGQEASAYENRGVVVGEQAAGMEDGVALGWRARSYSKQGVAIGRQAHAGEPNGTLPSSSIPTPAAYSQAVAIGYNARARAQGAVQIGDGVNTEANTMRFRGDRVAMMPDVTNIVTGILASLATTGLDIDGTTYYLTTVPPSRLSPEGVTFGNAYGDTNVVSAASIKMTSEVSGERLDMGASGMASPDSISAGFYYNGPQGSYYYTFPAMYGKIAVESQTGVLGSNFIDGTNVVAIGMVLSQPSGSNEESEEQPDQQDPGEESEGAAEDTSDQQDAGTLEEQSDQQTSDTSEDTTEEEPVYESAEEPLTLDHEQESNE